MSITNSLHNLQTYSSSPTIDTLILHSPLETLELTIRAWSALERHVPHEIRNLGISNIDAFTLKALYDSVTVKPAVVQNRFYPPNLWDLQVRRYCNEKGIVYQTFWTLTANPMLLKSKSMLEVAKKIGISIEAALYLSVMSLGKISVLNGTTSKEHMVEDLFSLGAWKQWISQDGNDKEWSTHMTAFRLLIRDM